MFENLHGRVEDWLDAVYRNPLTVTEMHINEGPKATVTVVAIGEDGEVVQDDIRLTVDERDNLAHVISEWENAWEFDDETPVEGWEAADTRSITYDGDEWTIRASFRTFRPAPSANERLGQLLSRGIDDDFVRYRARFTDGVIEHEAKIHTDKPHEYTSEYETREEYVRDHITFRAGEDANEKDYMNYTPEVNGETQRALDEWARETADEMIAVTPEDDSVTVTPDFLNVGFGVTTKCTFSVTQTL